MFWYDFGGALLRFKSTVPSPFKVTTGDHSHTIRTGRSKVATTRSKTTNPSSEISKSQT